MIDRPRHHRLAETAQREAYIEQRSGFGVGHPRRTLHANGALINCNQADATIPRNMPLPRTFVGFSSRDMQKVFRMLDSLNLPPGVVNLVNGGRDAVNAILDSPVIRAVSFVGSSATALYVYSRGAAAGKRVQCQGARRIR